MRALQASAPKPRWYLVPVRVLLATVTLTLLAFALGLLIGICAVAGAAKLRGLEPNFSLAYRLIAFPAAAAVAGIALAATTVVEVRAYRRAKTLEGIEQQMRA
ncbi:MAG: hypothetical protein JO159_16170 [Acidobacteria bacterium]|nr:hypothetical protein [Acidobacteriota bacterium]MBV9625342.1 hypothetical protein [Acidobacteriota bacterium]